ncbi:ribonuclease H-like domain-containing protein [Tanacetum coccineum]
MLNTQMSANDKFGLGYGDHKYDGTLSYENEVLPSVFMNKESELEKQPLYDRFVIEGGMHATQPSESESQTSEFDTCESNISTEHSELVSEPVVNESNVACQPKVWSDAPIIEEYESDSEDEYVSIPTKQQETPSFANQQVKTPRENVKSQFTHSQKPKVDKKDLGYGFTVRACFVCGSLNHLIRDCDFHEKRMARKANLNSGCHKKTSQKELRETWNNVKRVNKQNQFVPSAVLTRTGKIPVNTAKASSTKNFSTARQSVNRQTVLTSTAMKVNTVKPIVNRVRPANVFHKTHSPSSRPFKKTTVLRTDFSNQKLNTAKDYPHRALKNKGIVDSGCSRHMTGNKAYLAEFQDFNGGPVAFGGSKGYITGKGQQEANQNAGTEDIIDAGDSEKEDESAQDCFVLPIWPSYSSTITPVLKTDDKREGPREEEQVFMDELERLKRQEKEANEEAEALRKNTPAKASKDDSEIPPLEDIYQILLIEFTTSSYDDEGAVASFTNLETVVNVSPIPTSRIHSSHPTTLILRDPTSAVQTRSKLNNSSGAHAFVSYVQKQRRNNHKDFQHCLFACFLSQNEPKKISEALEDESWVDAMQEELLQFKIQKVWVLVDLPYRKKAIGKPKTSYFIINHYTDQRHLENEKMFLEGSELTKDKAESQLYEEFEHFRQIKGETIRRILRAANSKFVNNMLPEWSRFITEVKLNRGLKESNCDQLYAYLKQHEVHANENRIMMERFCQPNNDPLALVSDASVQQYPTQSSKSPQSSTEPYPSDNFQMNSGSSSTENLIESLSNSLAPHVNRNKYNLPQTNNQLRASSNARNKAMVQDGKVVVQDVRGRYNANNQGRPFQRNNARGNGVAGNVGGQNRGGIINPGQAKPQQVLTTGIGLGHIARECPRPKRLQDSNYFKDKMLLMQAQENGAVLDEEQSLFLAERQLPT